MAYAPWLAALVALWPAELVLTGSTSSTSCRPRCWRSAGARAGETAGRSPASCSLSARSSSGRRGSRQWCSSPGCSRHGAGATAIAHGGSFAADVLLAYTAVPRLGPRPGARGVLAPERAVDHARVGVVPAAASVRPRARADAHLVRCRCARLGGRARGRVLQVGCVLALVVAAVSCEDACAQRSRSPRWPPRVVPAHEPDLQPAVHDRRLRGVGAGRRARRRTRREQLAVGVAMALGRTANAFVYPFALPHYAETWVICSAVLFSVALALTGWLALRAVTAVDHGQRIRLLRSQRSTRPVARIFTQVRGRRAAPRRP